MATGFQYLELTLKYWKTIVPMALMALSLLGISWDNLDERDKSSGKDTDIVNMQSQVTALAKMNYEKNTVKTVIKAVGCGKCEALVNAHINGSLH